MAVTGFDRPCKLAAGGAAGALLYPTGTAYGRCLVAAVGGAGELEAVVVGLPLLPVLVSVL